MKVFIKGTGSSEILVQIQLSCRELKNIVDRRLIFGLSCTEFVCPGCWHFDDGAKCKIDDVLKFFVGRVAHRILFGIWT